MKGQVEDTMFHLGGFPLNRRILLALLLFIMSATIGPGAAMAEKIELLFVQSAPDVSVTGNELRLKNMNPLTLYFSDRPERLAGHYKFDEWERIWAEGRNSFLKDHPNAVLSVFEPGKEDPTDAAVELIDMRVEGADLVYKIRLLKGSLPAAGGQSSLFIDTFGMPMTPDSFAGVERRDARRHGLTDF
jgi:hypothetical protein